MTQRDVEAVVNIIREWSHDKMTWEAICEAAVAVIGSKMTRQTLKAHPEINAAYAAKKHGLQIHSPRTSMPGSLKYAAQRIVRLQSENKELKSINARLLEKFMRWQYNAYRRGVSVAELEQELPSIDRERTDGRTSTELRQKNKVK